MKLKLHHTKNIPQQVCAACIHGANIQQWLYEIDSWNININEIELYLLPQSTASRDVAALFVIFNNTTAIPSSALLEPYTCTAGKLYIPLHTAIHPQLHDEEIQQLLLWEIQVLHPVYGLVGFEKKDGVDINCLLTFTLSDQEDWSYAAAGVPAFVPLHSIHVIAPQPGELLESIRKEIGQKNLEDIPPATDESSKGKDALKRALFNTLKIFLGGIGLFSGILAIPFRFIENSNRPGKPLPPGNEKKTWLQQVQQWVQQNLDALQQQRNKELNRLLNLFDTDTDEALQYAIPLNSPYFDRGETTMPSGRLGKRSTEFNLGKISGGAAADYWDINQHYNSLRNKYLKAAEKEIEKKEFKKAAYVYAQLLGDYLNAAKVLEQGGYYREAAALYKDHLKNTMAAADCLEKGKLYLEAIELFKEMKQHEKAGDLYMLAERQADAMQHYEQSATDKLLQNSYLDAARLMDEKMQQPQRARETLLQGWNSGYQPGACLKQYFSMQEDEAAVQKEITAIYEHHTPRHKRLALIDVLEDINKTTNAAEVKNTITEIAYEVVHNEVESGNIQASLKLKNFLPGDKLIAGDVSRYIAVNRNKKEGAENPPIILDNTIQWKQTTWHLNQFLAAGIKDGCLHLARFNWYGNIEYYSWTNKVEAYVSIKFVSLPYYHNTIIMELSAGLPITRKSLPKNKYFNETISLQYPLWLRNLNGKFTINQKEELVSLSSLKRDFTLSYYSLTGDLKKTIPCTFDKDNAIPEDISHHSRLITDGSYYYCNLHKTILMIAENGRVTITALDTGIRFMASSYRFSAFHIVVSTNRGCLLCTPSDGGLSVSGEYFAKDITPQKILFISAVRFILIERKKAVLFDIIGDTAVKNSQYETTENIIDAIPMAQRHTFALLEEPGICRVYEVAENG